MMLAPCQLCRVARVISPPLTRRLHALSRSRVLPVSRCLSSVSSPPDGNCSSIARTHTCGALRASDAGATVTLQGWVASLRVLSEGLAFLSLRDAYGTTQVVVEVPEAGGATALLAAVRALRVEGIVAVRGTVRPRPASQVHGGAAAPTGAVEVLASALHILAAPAAGPLAVLPRGGGGDASEDVRLANRFLDLRRDVLQRNLRLRSLVAAAVRAELLCGGGSGSGGGDSGTELWLPFVEVETPTLFRSSPEGAREFLVPSRAAGRFYALPQSPQQFKQLLMCGGVDRYFQLARCYRDEGGRADRQPEFTQLDLEMAFPRGASSVMRVAEGVLRAAFVAAGEAARGRTSPGLPGYSFGHFTPRLVRWRAPALPLPALTYAHALSTYGSDKPDRRVGLPIRNVTGVLQLLHGCRGAAAAPAGQPLGDLLAAAVTASALSTPPMDHAATDPALDALLPGVWSARALVAPRLAAALSRREGDALLTELRRSLGGGGDAPAAEAAQHVALLRVEEGGVWRTACAASRAVPPDAQAAVSLTLGAQAGDAVLLAWGPRPLAVLGALGVARLLAAHASALKGLPLNPHGTAVAMRAEDVPAAMGRAACDALAAALAARAPAATEARSVADADGERDVDAFWVTDFPLFEEGDGVCADATLRSVHHPFTAAAPCHEAALQALLLEATPGGAALRPDARAALLRLRSQHYDVVVNGVEVGGGSIRVHDAATQEAILARVLRLAPHAVDAFAPLLAGLRAGAPPHGGLAMGLDRLVALLAGAAAAPSLRDVIAFPKSASGGDPLTGAPAVVTHEQLAEYCIRVAQ